MSLINGERETLPSSTPKKLGLLGALEVWCLIVLFNMVMMKVLRWDPSFPLSNLKKRMDIQLWLTWVPTVSGLSSFGSMLLWRVIVKKKQTSNRCLKSEHYWSSILQNSTAYHRYTFILRSTSFSKRTAQNHWPRNLLFLFSACCLVLFWILILDLFLLCMLFSRCCFFIAFIILLFLIFGNILKTSLKKHGNSKNSKN